MHIVFGTFNILLLIFVSLAGLIVRHITGLIDMRILQLRTVITISLYMDHELQDCRLLWFLLRLQTVHLSNIGLCYNQVLVLTFYGYQCGFCRQKSTTDQIFVLTNNKCKYLRQQINNRKSWKVLKNLLCIIFIDSECA